MKQDAQELPVGLTMALAQNIDAMQIFTQLPGGARQEVIERAKSAKSREEMQRLVLAISDGRLK